MIPLLGVFFLVGSTMLFVVWIARGSGFTALAGRGRASGPGVRHLVQATLVGDLLLPTAVRTSVLVSRYSKVPTVHDDIVGSLFAAGLNLDRLADRLSDPEDRAVLDAAVQHLDDVVRDVRLVLHAASEPDWLSPS